MDSPSIVSNKPTTQFCDVILESLRNDVNTPDDVEAFSEEVQTLRKFLDLIDRVFKAKLPRMAFEEQHFSCVEVLLDRCKTTLSRLAEIFTALGSVDHQARAQKDLQGILQILQSFEVVALRVKIAIYIKTLQMSLQTVKLYIPRDEVNCPVHWS